MGFKLNIFLVIIAIFIIIFFFKISNPNNKIVSNPPFDTNIQIEKPDLESDYNSSNTANIVNEDVSPEKYIELLFYDNKTKCAFSGEIYSDNQLLGKFVKGVYILNKTNYDSKFYYNVTISIKGETDECFGNNQKTPFEFAWNIYNLDYYFNNNLPLKFNINFNLQDTLNKNISLLPYKNMQKLIKPEEVKTYFDKIKAIYTFNNDAFDDLKKLNDYMMMISYTSNKEQYGVDNYWATPLETLSSNKGDCKGWSTAFLSLVKSYNSNLKCYLMHTTIHLSVFCINKEIATFVIYDQQRIATVKKLYKYDGIEQNRIQMQGMINSYFETFGLDPDEREIHALVDEKDIIIFDKEDHNKDFVDWAISQI